MYKANLAQWRYNLEDMESSIIIEVLIVLLLISSNGLFAMSELAILSARKSRLQQWANKGDKRAKQALALAESPDEFLSTVQIGITLVGILAGVFGGATLAKDLASLLVAVGLPAQYGDAVGVAITVSIITYLSLVIGELVPKNLALSNAERIATAVAPTMHRLSRLAYPFVRLLSLSTAFITRLLGVRPSAEPPVTEAEIEMMMSQGAEVGVFEPEEPEMVRRIFRLGNQRVGSLMTPRREIVWLDRSEEPEKIRHKVMAAGFSRFPVAVNDLDNVVGMVHVADMLKHWLSGEAFDPYQLVHPPLFVPESIPALDLLERFKTSHTHTALVIDEYGGLAGLVTSNDLLEAIVGDIDRPANPPIVQRADGSWLLDGLLPVMDLLELLHWEELPPLGKSHYHTVGGLMMAALEEVPMEGASFVCQGFCFEVVDMDGLRVDKVLVTAVSDDGQRMTDDG